MRIRLLLHALDRTGPPVLAATFAAWAERELGWHVEVLAFRGGALAGDARWSGPARIVLDDEEPWDHAAPDPMRVADLGRKLADLGPVDANLLVSVAAGQVLPLVPHDVGPIVTWVVEQGEDLHWVHDLPALRARTDRWLAGTEGVADEIMAVLGVRPDVSPEFVLAETDAPAATVAACRAELGARSQDLLVVGAGIATYRKGIDLFLEVALAATRAAGVDASSPACSMRFVWVGGERDPLHHPVADEAMRLGVPLEVVPVRSDLGSVLAASDAVLHPARLDAFPLVCLQASLVGTPVVGFGGAGGLEEMFGSSFVGAPYPDVAALGRRILELAAPDRRDQVARAQRARASRFEVGIAGPVLAAALGGVPSAGAVG